MQYKTNLSWRTAERVWSYLANPRDEKQMQREDRTKPHARVCLCLLHRYLGWRCVDTVYQDSIRCSALVERVPDISSEQLTPAPDGYLGAERSILWSVCVVIVKSNFGSLEVDVDRNKHEAASLSPFILFSKHKYFPTTYCDTLLYLYSFCFCVTSHNIQPITETQQCLL